MKRLAVFVDGVRVGTLHDTDPLSFTYANECLEGHSEPPFSALIPVQPGIINDASVRSFFENLLPEGDERSLLQEKHQVTSVFGLLEQVGADTAGSVVLLPEWKTLAPNGYLAITWELVSNLVNDEVIEFVPISAIAVETNAAVPGAQPKMLLMVRDGQPHIPVGGSVSTHILKADINRTGSKIFSSAYNEALIMKLAQACDMPVANTEYVAEAKSCLVERYDRYNDSGELQRLYQVDLCQLLGVTSDRKYENDGGPSFKECYDMVRRQSSVPVTDCHLLLKWVFFNLLIGNHDSHAKNISMLLKDGKLRLAPFYDLMCTRIYSGLSKNFAFKIGQHFEPGQINQEDLVLFADSLGVNYRILIKIAQDMHAKIMKALPVVMNEKLAKVEKGSGEEIIQERIFNDIKSHSERFIKRIAGG